MRRASALALGILMAGGLACGSDRSLAPGTARQDAETGFWQLTVNHQAVTLSTVAPYDTIRLVATPRNAAGVPRTGPVLDSAVTTYSMLNPRDTTLLLMADGLVRAHAVHDGSIVIVRTTVRGLTRVDSIPVNVTATVPPAPAATLVLSITPDTLTGVGLFAEAIGSVTAQVLDGAGQPIPHAAVRLRTDPARLSLQVDLGQTSGVVLPHDIAGPGQASVVAEATVYGVTVGASVPVTVTPPAKITLRAIFGTPKSVGHPVGHFEPVVDTVLIGTDPFTEDVGALVSFQNSTATPIDVVWDDPAAVQGSSYELFCGSAPVGNIPAFVTPTFDNATCPVDPFGQLRLLPVPGTYHYHSALYGTSGTIVVLAP